MQTNCYDPRKSDCSNFHARIYDESQPDQTIHHSKNTMGSRSLWNAFHHGPKLFLSLFHRQLLREWMSKVDNLLYLFTMLNYGIAALNIIVTLVAFGLGLVVDHHIPYISYLLLSNLILQYMIIYPSAVILDGPPLEKKRFLKDYFMNIIAIFLSGIVFTVSSISGLLKYRNQSIWKKTTHSVTSMEQRDKNKESYIANNAVTPSPNNHSEGIGVGSE